MREEMNFTTLPLTPYILNALKQLQYEKATPIQHAVISQFDNQTDLIALAQTGTGKTGSFAIPILDALVRENSAGIAALILSPTRELALQITTYFQKIDFLHQQSICTLIGGMPIDEQIAALQQDKKIIVATPGRLVDLLERKAINLHTVRYYVLDEADQMLTLGFKEALERISAALTTNKKTLLFSATMSKPIQLLCQQIIPQAETIALQQAQPVSKDIKQTLYYVQQDYKQLLLLEQLRLLSTEHTAFIFVKSKVEADRLSDFLNQANQTNDRLHADRSQHAREEIMAKLHDKSLRLLVATDVAARGIDLDHVTHVFNYDLPQNTESFVHRIGRTARNGRTGFAITLCDPSETKALAEVEKLIKQKLPIISGHTFDNLHLKKAMEKVAKNHKKPAKRFNRRR